LPEQGGRLWSAGPSDGLYVETDCNVTTLDHWEHAPETQDGPLDEVLKECGEFE